MTADGPSYRAYIAYSHQDEGWAAWLHRAIETYRVPARLGGERRAPRRLTPVFRDRDELPSASSLGDKLLQALAGSEFLVVVCSPAAAASRWVNEEVRQFRALGRDDRILCMVVDGDPSDPGRCFPPALFEGAEGKTLEPLAADPRPWADGKRLAKLKIVAGLLGVGLDELRRRDLVRRRRWQAGAVLAALVAAALLVQAVTSSIAERQQREKNEQLAGFVVDLGERLQSNADVQTLGLIAGEAMRYLDSLDPASLSTATSIRLGKALRQLGRANAEQGKVEEALDAYERSRELFRLLRERNPGDPELLFELAQAEYYVGERHWLQGDIEAARAPWARYLELAQALAAQAPGDPRGLLEVAYGKMNILILRIESGEPANDDLMAAVEESVDLARRVREAMPGELEATSHYANMVAWAADASRDLCDLGAAESYRREALRLAEEVARDEPSNEMRERLAYARRGLGSVLLSQGRLEAARAEFGHGLELLEELKARDPANRVYAEALAVTEVMSSGLLTAVNEPESAIAAIERAATYFEPAPDPLASTERERRWYFDFALAAAETWRIAGDSEKSRRYLGQALTVLRSFGSVAGWGQAGLLYPAGLLAYRRWLQLEEEPPFLSPEELAALSEAYAAGNSCLDAALWARLSVMRGEAEPAAERVALLLARGYRPPRFLDFCRRHGLCED